MHRYEVIVRWGQADAAFVAHVQVVMAEWVEAAKELGRPIPEPRGRLMFA